jgi:hypothetical protein
MMYLTHTTHHRPLRTLAVMAACCAAALAAATAALASNGVNYGNFNPMTGKPYTTLPQVGLHYGDFNPLSGRPNSAPQPPSSRIPVSTVREPAARTIQTVVHDHGSPTLPLSLAGAALLIAIAGIGYTTLRLSRMPHPVRGR